MRHWTLLCWMQLSLPRREPPPQLSRGKLLDRFWLYTHRLNFAAPPQLRHHCLQLLQPLQLPRPAWSLALSLHAPTHTMAPLCRLPFLCLPLPPRLSSTSRAPRVARPTTSSASGFVLPVARAAASSWPLTPLLPMVLPPLAVLPQLWLPPPLKRPLTPLLPMAIPPLAVLLLLRRPPTLLPFLWTSTPAPTPPSFRPPSPSSLLSRPRTCTRDTPFPPPPHLVPRLRMMASSRPYATARVPPRCLDRFHGSLPSSSIPPALRAARYTTNTVSGSAPLAAPAAAFSWPLTPLLPLLPRCLPLPLLPLPPSAEMLLWLCAMTPVPLRLPRTVSGRRTAPVPRTRTGRRGTPTPPPRRPRPPPPRPCPRGP